MSVGVGDEGHKTFHLLLSRISRRPACDRCQGRPLIIFGLSCGSSQNIAAIAGEHILITDRALFKGLNGWLWGGWLLRKRPISSGEWQSLIFNLALEIHKNMQKFCSTKNECIWLGGELRCGNDRTTTVLISPFPFILYPTLSLLSEQI